MSDLSGCELPPLDLDLSISIVTWNSRDDVLDCLASIGAAADPLNWIVTVVDNASCDGTVEAVRAAHPEMVTLAKGINRGFGAAHNEVMRRGVGRYHLILNPDTRLFAGSLVTLVRFLEEHGEVGLVGPKVLERDGSVYPSFRSFPTAGALLFRNKLLTRLFPHNPYTRHYLRGDQNPDVPQSTDWISGSAILIRREALASIGLLDERFFMYCEDMDWCRRAHDSGWDVFYQPDATMTHLRARSTDRCIPQMIVEHHKSMGKYYVKHEAPHNPVWRNAAAAAAIFLRCFVVLGAYAVRKVGAASRKFGLIRKLRGD